MIWLTHSNICRIYSLHGLAIEKRTKMLTYEQLGGDSHGRNGDGIDDLREAQNQGPQKD